MRTNESRRATPKLRLERLQITKGAESDRETEAALDNNYMALRSRSFHKSIARALGHEPVDLHGGIARLAVLYEDLRIELTAAKAPEGKFAELEVIGKAYRQMYFLRRSIATIRDFAEEVKYLHGLPAYVPVRRQFEDSEAIDMWIGGVEFFKSHFEYLQNIRNDYGGHFSRAAAHYAVSNIDPSIVGTVEINFSLDGKANPKAFFAAPIVDKAMLRRQGKKVDQKYAAEMIDFANKAHEHAGTCMHVLFKYYLIPRFSEP